MELWICALDCYASIDVKTSFLILREGKIIFDGDAPALTATRDEYIKEYIA